MVAAFENNNILLACGMTCEFDGVLNGLGARIEKNETVQPFGDNGQQRLDQLQALHAVADIDLGDIDARKY